MNSEDYCLLKFAKEGLEPDMKEDLVVQLYSWLTSTSTFHIL